MVIFFDIDDTLIDHTAAVRAAALVLHASARVPVASKAFIEDWQHAHRRHYPRYLAGDLSYADASRARIRDTIGHSVTDDAADAFFAIYLKAYEASWTLWPDVVPCLDLLASVRLGVISNGRTDEQRRKLTSMAISDRFEYVLISEDCGFCKPSSEMFRLACRRAGISARDAWHVGDHYELDARAARRADLQGVWLDRAGVASDEHEGMIINSLCELTDLIETGRNKPAAAR